MIYCKADKIFIVENEEDVLKLFEAGFMDKDKMEADRVIIIRKKEKDDKK